MDSWSDYDPTAWDGWPPRDEPRHRIAAAVLFLLFFEVLTRLGGR